MADLVWADRLVEIGGRTFQLRTPVNPDQLLETVTERTGVDEPEPYWAAIWTASIGLAEMILSRNWRPGLKAAELGCGLGIVGLAGLAKGLDLVFTDYVPEAVEAAVANAQRNGYPQARGALLDWRSPPDWQIPFILAADILYERQSHRPLLKTLTKLLTPDGEAWIGEPGRSVSQEFIELAVNHSFSVVCCDASFRSLPIDSYQLNQFRLLRLTRCHGPGASIVSPTREGLPFAC